MRQTTKKTNARTPALRGSVEQVWLAGLGALALTEDEGTKLFRTLVKRGESFERTTRARLGEVVESARQAPGVAIERLEEGFDDTMTGVLHRFGVPTQREINALARRVEGLAHTLDRGKPRRSAPARKATRATRRRTRPSAESATA
jgi:poly(hydroxyalkanoate) granule-associated protein